MFEERLPRVALDPESPLAGFAEAAETWLEIGFGGGEHLAACIVAHPGIRFIGCEPFETGVAKLLAEVPEDALDRLRVLMDDARLMLDKLPDASIDRVFLLFPDPWPKTRHHKRRFVTPENLAEIARVLKDGGRFRYVSDDIGYVRWTLARMPACPDLRWTARRPDDWRVRPDDWVETRYEQKALAAGRSCTYLDFVRRRRDDADQKLE
ncbi:MAG: tRNA (guanine(46)-N(7))-methyltransferase TrmB [Alphaproteobacteria bacterium]